MKQADLFKGGSIAVATTWIGLFFVAPVMLVFIMSVMHVDPVKLIKLPLTLQHYLQLFHWVYLKIYIKTVSMAVVTTLVCLMLGYPLAYIIANSPTRQKGLYMFLLIVPFWTNSLIRVYGMLAVLKNHGLLNKLLLSLGIIHQPLPLLYSNTAVILGLVYNLLPFMVLPLVINIERLDQRLIAAAKDLGASTKQIFLKIIFPLCIPGIIAGCILVFLPAMTLFYIPVILGGAKSLMLGNLIENQFLFARNWPFASAMSIGLMLVVMCLAVIYWRNTSKKERGALL